MVFVLVCWSNYAIAESPSPSGANSELSEREGKGKFAVGLAYDPDDYWSIGGKATTKPLLGNHILSLNLKLSEFRKKMGVTYENRNVLGSGFVLHLEGFETSFRYQRIVESSLGIGSRMSRMLSDSFGAYTGYRLEKIEAGTLATL